MHEHPYSQLTPERVLDALGEAGLRPDGRLLSLNSYENRVYQAWLEDDTVVVVWSRTACTSVVLPAA